MPSTPGVEFGVFAKVFPTGSAVQVGSAIAAAGFTTTQLNLSAIGRPTLDRSLTSDGCLSIRADFRSAGVRIWSVSGTFNAIDPDLDRRRSGIEGCRHLVSVAPSLGADVITLCSGTRDPHDMWRAHPANTDEDAWSDLRRTLDELLPAAAASGVRLGIEPEPGNVIRDAHAADRLMEQLGHDARHVAIVLDPANLLTAASLPDQASILTEAFELLGPHTAGVHAKDVVEAGRAESAGSAAPGYGGMDYDLVMRLHQDLPQSVPVIAQDLAAADAVRVRRFLGDHVPQARRT